MHRAPHPAWPYFPSVLDSIENIIECEALCVVRKLSYLFTHGLDVMGDIITQCVRGCTLHRFTSFWPFKTHESCAHMLPKTSLGIGHEYERR